MLPNELVLSVALEVVALRLLPRRSNLKVFLSTSFLMWHRKQSPTLTLHCSRVRCRSTAASFSVYSGNYWSTSSRAAVTCTWIKISSLLLLFVVFVVSSDIENLAMPRLVRTTLLWCRRRVLTIWSLKDMLTSFAPQFISCSGPRLIATLLVASPFKIQKAASWNAGRLCLSKRNMLVVRIRPMYSQLRLY